MPRRRSKIWACCPRLILVTGPTGSGKSTTLAGMVNHCNDNRPDHIITIEDPIEFVHESKRCLVNQREVHRDTLGFTRPLRSALREEPGRGPGRRMRDLETIRLALTAAETGIWCSGRCTTSYGGEDHRSNRGRVPAAEKGHGAGHCSRRACGRWSRRRS